MNNFIDVMFKTIAIVFLLVLTLFMFSLLVEYIRFLWLRRIDRKELAKINKIIDERGPEFVAPNLNEEQLEKLSKAIEKEIGHKINGIDVVRFDTKGKEKKKNK